jgi:hypothetical protein
MPISHPAIAIFYLAVAITSAARATKTKNKRASKLRSIEAECACRAGAQYRTEEQRWHFGGRS